jgi:hypothetical protein
MAAMDTKSDTKESKVRPRLSYNDMDKVYEAKGWGWRDPRRTAFETTIDHLQRAIFYPMCRWTYMDGVDALKVLNPEHTSPKGCLVRAVTFVSNSGSSTVQLELRWDETAQEYLFWVHASKYEAIEFRSSEYDIDQLILLYLRILCKWNYGEDGIDYRGRRNPGRLIREHLKDFKRRTRVKKLKPKHWTLFEVLLHHVVLYDKKPYTTHLQVHGWNMSWQEGDHLSFSGHGKSTEWYSPIRGPATCYLTGDRHCRMCPDGCDKCEKRKMEEVFQKAGKVNADVVGTILEYSK